MHAASSVLQRYCVQSGGGDPAPVQVVESLEERLENRDIELAAANTKIAEYERQIHECTCCSLVGGW